MRLITDLKDVYERARPIMDVRAARSEKRVSYKADRKFYRPGDIFRVQVNSLAEKLPTRLAPI